MKMFRASRIISLFLALSLSLSLSVTAAYENTHKNTGTQAFDVLAVALSQIGYEEGAKNESKYADWYGLPKAPWCAMFVSWCLNEAGVKEEQVKPFASCTASMKDLKNSGIWQDSPAYGGSYTPEPGDLIYFNWYGTSVCNHVGIVLYVEDGWVYTIEGNTNANRLDEHTKPSGSADADSSVTGIRDEVLIRCRELGSKFIRGYGTPAYKGRPAPVEKLPAIADVPQGSTHMTETQRVLDAGLMGMMSSRTFGYKYGVTRGEYVAALAEFFGMPYDGTAAGFADVGEEHPAYEAVMAFRAAGLVSGVAGNYFDPDTYITPYAAQVILDRLCRYLHVDPVAAGYKGKPVDGYLQRFELAHALCLLMDCQTAHAPSEAVVSVGGVVSTLATEVIGGAHYVTAADWEALFSDTETAVSTESLAAQTGSVPDGWLQHASLTQDDGNVCEMNTITLAGVQWYKLRDIANATGIGVEWDSALQAIGLITPHSETADLAAS